MLDQIQVALFIIELEEELSKIRHSKVIDLLPFAGEVV